MQPGAVGLGGAGPAPACDRMREPGNGRQGSPDPDADRVLCQATVVPG